MLNPKKTISELIDYLAGFGKGLLLHPSNKILHSLACSAGQLINKPVNESCLGSNQFEMAERLDSIIVSPIDRSDSLVRTYAKYKSMADIYPFYGMLPSQLGKIAELLSVEMGHVDEQNEWLVLQDERHLIVSSDDDPLSHKLWFKYTMDQKKLIVRAHQREKLTRHKSLKNCEYFKVKS